MRRINLRFLCVIFNAFPIVLIGLFFYALLFKPNDANVSSKLSVFNTHITIGSEFGGCIVIFNYGMPYVGNVSFIRGVTIAESHLPGAYYAVIRNRTSAKIWRTFIFSIWYPISFFSILTSECFVRKLRKDKTVPISESANL